MKAEKPIQETLPLMDCRDVRAIKKPFSDEAVGVALDFSLPGENGHWFDQRVLLTQKGARDLHRWLGNLLRDADRGYHDCLLDQGAKIPVHWEE